MKHLINLFLLLALLIPIEVLAADSTTPMVTVGGGTSTNFSIYDSTYYPNLSAATSITVTGTWTKEQVVALKYALKNNNEHERINDKLKTANMSTMKLSGDITTGFNSFFQNNIVLTEVILPQAVTIGEVYFNSVFLGCTVLTTITNLDKFTGGGNFAFAFQYCSSLKEVTFSEVTNTKEVLFHSAFYGCTTLTTINNLDKFTGVNSFANAFLNCSSLTSVSLGNIPTGSNTLYNAFLGANPNCLIYLPTGTTEAQIPTASTWLGRKYLAHAATQGAPATALSNINLIAGHPYHCPIAFTVPEGKTISYTHTNLTPDTYHALVLPFVGTLSTTNQAGGSIIKTFRVSDYTFETPNFSQAEQTIVNWPFLCYTGTGSSITITGTNQTVAVTPSRLLQTYDAFLLRATYSPVTTTSSNILRLQADGTRFVKAGEAGTEVNHAPFEVYMETKGTEEIAVVDITPQVITEDGTIYDFTNATAESFPNLSTAESITVTGTWTDEQVTALKYASKGIASSSRYNDKLKTADMSAMKLGGDIPNGFQYFFQRDTVLTEVILPREVTTGAVAFYGTFSGCKALTTITGLEKFKGISSLSSAFSNCSSLKEITFPEVKNDKTVSFQLTFYGCTSLTTINNLDKFIEVSDFQQAFRNCSSLTSVSLAKIPTASNSLIMTFEGTNPNCLKYLLSGSATTSALAGGWKDYPNFIVAGTAYKNIELTEGHPFHCPTAFTVPEGKTISYSRNNLEQDTFHALTLPFVGELSPENYEHGSILKTFRGAYLSKSPNFSQAEQTTPNVPFICSTGIGSFIIITGTAQTVAATPGSLSQAFDTFTLHATYWPVGSNTGNTMCLLADGTRFVRAGEAGRESFAPFEAYIEAEVAEGIEVVDLEPRVLLKDGTVHNFTDATSRNYPNLSAAESVTVVGMWTNEQVLTLRYALKNSTVIDVYNNTLKTVDMSAMKLSGDITTEFQNFFQNHTVLTEVTLPQKVNTGTVSFSNTFNGCKALESITGLDKFTGISNFYQAFNGCSSLREVTLAGEINTNTVSFANAFYGCNALTSITGLEKFTGVSTFEQAFYNCSSLKKVTLAEEVNAREISFRSIFVDCTALTSITGLDKFTGISNFYQAFYNCSSLKEITFSQEINAKEISFQSSFVHCTALTSITGLDKFTGVSNFFQAFVGCSSLKEIILAEEINTKTVSFSYAFRDCTALTTITGLDKFTGANNFQAAFLNCSSLTSVSLGNVPSSESTYLRSTFTDTNPNCLKYLPLGANTTDALTGDWKDYPNFIVAGTTYKNITLTDGKPFHCPTAFTVPEGKTISYTRDFTGDLATRNNGWNTLVLPFDGVMITGDTEQTPFASNEDTDGSYWLKTYTSNADEETLSFSHTGNGKNILANIPYLIALPGEEFGAASMHLNPVMQFTASDITVPATPEASELSHAPEGSDFAYIGNYVSLRSEDIYILLRGEGEENDVFACPPSGIKAGVLPFRAYIKEIDTDGGGANGARMLSIGNEDGITGLSPAISQEEEAGREANKAYKIMTPDGIRIVKGDRVYTIEGRSLTPTLSEREGAGR